MTVIHKYPLWLSGGPGEHDHFNVPLPSGAIVRHIDYQPYQGGRGALCLWAEVTPANPTEVRCFRPIGTGETVPQGTYLATVQDPPYVWHIYEVTP